MHLHIRLQPRASREEISGQLGDRLKIKVTAPPVEAAANQALLRLLARHLGCPRSALRIARGHASRQKTIEIKGLAIEEVARRLG